MSELKVGDLTSVGKIQVTVAMEGLGAGNRPHFNVFVGDYRKTFETSKDGFWAGQTFLALAEIDLSHIMIDPVSMEVQRLERAIRSMRAEAEIKCQEFQERISNLLALTYTQADEAPDAQDSDDSAPLTGSGAQGGADTLNTVGKVDDAFPF